MCNCLKQKLIDISYNKSNLKNVQKENFNNFNDKIFSDKIDLKKYNMNISPRENINNIKKSMYRIYKQF